MDTRSDFVETDLLTFDIPDDLLERAAGAELAFTLVHCSNPLVWDCPAVERWRRSISAICAVGIRRFPHVQVLRRSPPRPEFAFGKADIDQCDGTRQSTD
jgi:hypothetical protein